MVVPTSLLTLSIDVIVRVPPGARREFNVRRGDLFPSWSCGNGYTLCNSDSRSVIVIGRRASRAL
jgi:hypothetical protein